jgi:hypothetical protein
MAAFGTAGRRFGGYVIDRAVFRELLPEHRILVYAAGIVDPGDGNNATISLRYLTDAIAAVTLGTVVRSGAGPVKVAMGPFDLFATVGVPAGEQILAIDLHAIKNAGTNGVLWPWNIHIRRLPALV